MSGEPSMMKKIEQCLVNEDNPIEFEQLHVILIKNVRKNKERAKFVVEKTLDAILQLQGVSKSSFRYFQPINTTHWRIQSRYNPLSVHTYTA